MEKLELNVDELLLDHQNPRIGRVSSQAEALRSIIDLDHRHFRTMMESIRDHGLDPGDAFYIIAEEGFEDYIVVDGNRRLSALKVLREPNLLQATGIDDRLRSRLLSVAQSFDSKNIETVNCVLFDSREAANDWILRRHGRGMDGEARIFWGTLEIQRFQKDQTILDVIDFVERNSTFTDERWSQIKAAVEKKPSVLKRFIDSKPVKQLLGYSTSNVEGEMVPSFSAEPEQTLNVLSQIFEDIADGEIDTRTHNKADDIQSYVDDLPKTSSAKGKKQRALSKKFRETLVTSEKPQPRLQQAEPAPPAAKQTKVKPPRPCLAPSRHPFKQPLQTKAQRLLYEASKAKLKEMPLACAFILRAFLQHTIDLYMDDHKLPMFDTKKNVPFDLKHRATTVLDHLVKAKTATAYDLRGVRRTLTNPTDPVSIQALNDYHHNPFHIPSGDNLRSAWDAAEAMFIAVYGKA